MKFKKRKCRECGGTGKMTVLANGKEPYDEIVCVICDGAGEIDFPVFDAVIDRTCPLCGVEHSYRCRFDDRLKDSDGKTFYPQG